MSGHLSPEAGAPGGRRSGPAAYLDLAGQGRRSCLALHLAGFAWPPRHRDAGALLPHHFTFACTRLTCGRAIGRVFLWHCPAGFPGWALPTASPYGVRTFLEGFSLPPQSLGPPIDGSAGHPGALGIEGLWVPQPAGIKEIELSVGKLTERPGLILILPRWRGVRLRLLDLPPALPCACCRWQ